MKLDLIEVFLQGVAIATGVLEVGFTKNIHVFRPLGAVHANQQSCRFVGPTAEVLSLRKPSLVFALTGQPLAVQIRSRRICALSKESIQRKGNPDAAYFLRSSGLNGVFRRGFPTPTKNAMFPCIAPNGLIRPNPPVLGAA